MTNINISIAGIVYDEMKGNNSKIQAASISWIRQLCKRNQHADYSAYQIKKALVWLIDNGFVTKNDSMLHNIYYSVVA